MYELDLPYGARVLASALKLGFDWLDSFSHEEKSLVIFPTTPHLLSSEPRTYSAQTMDCPVIHFLSFPFFLTATSVDLYVVLPSQPKPVRP